MHSRCGEAGGRGHVVLCPFRWCRRHLSLVPSPSFLLCFNSRFENQLTHILSTSPLLPSHLLHTLTSPSASPATLGSSSTTLWSLSSRAHHHLPSPLAPVPGPALPLRLTPRVGLPHLCAGAVHTPAHGRALAETGQAPAHTTAPAKLRAVKCQCQQMQVSTLARLADAAKAGQAVHPR